MKLEQNKNNIRPPGEHQTSALSFGNLLQHPGSTTAPHLFCVSAPLLVHLTAAASGCPAGIKNRLFSNRQFTRQTAGHGKLQSELPLQSWHTMKTITDHQNTQCFLPNWIYWAGGAGFFKKNKSFATFNALSSLRFTFIAFVYHNGAWQTKT